MTQAVTASQPIVRLPAAVEFPHATPSFLELHDEFQRIRDSIFTPGTVTLNFPVVVQDTARAYTVCDQLAEEVENVRDRLWKEFGDNLHPTKEELQAHTDLVESQVLEFTPFKFSPQTKELINLRGLTFFIGVTTRNLDGLYVYSEVTEFFSKLLSEESLEVSSDTIAKISEHIKYCKGTYFDTEGYISNLLANLCDRYKDKDLEVSNTLISGETLAPFMEAEKNMREGIVRIAVVFNQLGLSQEPYESIIKDVADAVKPISNVLALNRKITELLKKMDRCDGDKHRKKRKKIQDHMNEHIAMALKNDIRPEEIFGVFKKHLRRSINASNKVICQLLKTDLKQASDYLHLDQIYFKDISCFVRAFTGVIADEPKIEELLTELGSIVKKTEEAVAAKKVEAPKDSSSASGI